jgi:hypothetical protein
MVMPRGRGWTDSLDELEELETGRIEQVVLWHCFVQDVQDWFKESVLYYLLVMERVVQAQTRSKEPQGHQFEMLFWAA